VKPAAYGGGGLLALLLLSRLLPRKPRKSKIAVAGRVGARVVSDGIGDEKLAVIWGRSK
jgi:hypothetical protein